MGGTKLYHRDRRPAKGISLKRELQVLELQREQGGDSIHGEDPQDAEKTDLDPLEPQVKSLLGRPEDGFIEGSQILNMDPSLLAFFHVQFPFVHETSKTLFTD